MNSEPPAARNTGDTSGESCNDRVNKTGGSCFKCGVSDWYSTDVKPWDRQKRGYVVVGEKCDNCGTVKTNK